METNNENPITGKEGSPINLKLAANWTKNYRERHPDEAISQFFGKEILENILAQEGCLGIRFYYAHDHHGKKHLVITGVSGNGDDQISEEEFEAAEAPAPAGAELMGAMAPKMYTVGDQSYPCPGSPGCPKNVLTGGK